MRWRRSLGFGAELEKEQFSLVVEHCAQGICRSQRIFLERQWSQARLAPLIEVVRSIDSIAWGQQVSMLDLRRKGC